MVSALATLVAVGVSALALTCVDAHGILVKPQIKFTGTAYGGDFIALVPQTSLTVQPGERFSNYPNWTANAKAFGNAFRKSQYKSLKEFLLTNQDLSLGRFRNPKTPECGFTDPTGGSVVALPDQLEWQGGQMNHEGPCEVWCDDEVVLPFTENCARTFPLGKFKYDKAKCVGKNRLTMYWMSTLMSWQVYIQCAKIGNGPQPAPQPAPKPKPAPKPVPAPTAAPKPVPKPVPAPTPKPDDDNTGGEAKPGCKRRLRED